MDDPQVTVIIINWNGWKDTIECLESLYQINYSNYDVIVVDNNSQDKSLDKIREYAQGKIPIKSDFFQYNLDNKPLKIKELTNKESESSEIIKNGFKELKSDDNLILIKNSENYGFAEGNNIGIRFALKFLNPDYILLLNNDTVVIRDFLKELIYTGEKNKEIGILGPKIYYYDEPDVIWSAGCKISWKLARGIQIGTNQPDHGQYNEKKEVEYVSGSAFLLKREVINKTGLMDKDYFLYFEESDLTLRANQAGYKSLYVPNAMVWHKVSRSGGGISKPIGLYYITRNRWIFMKKWAKRSDYWLFILYQALGAIIFPISLSVYYKNFKLFSAYYRGLWSGLQSK